VLNGAIREVTSSEAALVRSAVSSERQRVASELRAGVAQELALMAAYSDWIARQPPEERRLDVLSASVERALDESRGAIAALARPVDESVVSAVAHAARDVAARLGVQVAVQLDEQTQVTREWREALARFTRDALVLAVREGGAENLVVELSNGRPVVLRVVHDGGPAFAPGPGGDHGIEVRALRERVEVLGAIVTLGPVVEVQLP
jgi:signal transduction histidine kinase